MTSLNSRFRLSSTAFERPDEKNKIDPKRFIILSVEGDETERTYFQNLNRHLDRAQIQVEILRHRQGDGYSDPRYVIELLNEYVNVRQGQLIPDELPQSFTDIYDKEVINQYLKNKEHIDSKLRKKIEDELLKIGIDIKYRRYLQQFNQENDVFAIVVDRDCGNHSRQLMEECVQKCRGKNYECFITNPCFEFWLLLHLCDVKTEYSGEEIEKKLYENSKVSDRHTFVSLEVSNRAHHKKHISPGTFDAYYYPNILKAIENAQSYDDEYPAILDKLGTNLPRLFSYFGY